MKSVHAGQLRQVSASQISKFDASQLGGCNRRWYFDKVLGISEPTTKSLERGTSVHSEIEHYLKTGENVLGDIARAGMKFIPSEQIELHQIEVDLQNAMIADVPLTGRIDLVNDSEFWIGEYGEKQDQVCDSLEIVDWKTTSNLSYAKSGLDLLQTVQMPLYGYHIGKHPLKKYVRLSHVYFQTRGAAKAKKSTALFSLDEITSRYQAIERVVELMKQAAQLPNVTDLEPNPQSCHAFGRECAYAPQCPRSQRQLFDSYFGTRKEGEETMGLFDKIKKQQSPAQTNGIAPHSVETVLSQAQAQASVDDEVKRLEAEERALRAFGATPQSIVPTDAKPSEGEGTYVPEPKQAGNLFDRPKRFTPPTKPAEPQPAYFDDTSIGEHAEREERKAYLEAHLKPQEVAQVEVATPSARSLTLYINCAVRGVETQDLQVIINRACQDIQKQYNTPDIRLGKEPLAFGGWKAVLASVLRGYNLDGRWSIHGSGDIVVAAIEALDQQATLVVRGV